MSNKLTLENRRILITDVPEGIGNDLIRGILAKKGTVIAFAKTPEHIKDLENAYPALIPILLDVTKCPEASRSILSKLPYLDHIINLSGSVFDTVLGSVLKHYRPETADFRTTKADDVVSKLVLAGSRSTVVNFGETGSSNFSGSSASLAATQFTDALRTSFRKLFRGKSASEAESVPSHPPAKRSSTVPVTSNQPATKLTQNSTASTSTTSPTRKLSLKLFVRKSSSGSSTATGNLKGADEKLKKSFTKMHKEHRKVWERKLKKLKSKELKRMAELNREADKIKRAEKSSINDNNAALNAATMSRADVLSPETANKIIASREKKAEKNASRLAEKKFVELRTKLQPVLDADLAAAVEKHYQKILKKEIEVLEKRATNQQRIRR